MVNLYVWPLVVFIPPMPLAGVTLFLQDLAVLGNRWPWMVVAVAQVVLSCFAFYLMTAFRPVPMRAAVPICSIPWAMSIPELILAGFDGAVTRAEGRLIVVLVCVVAVPMTALGSLRAASFLLIPFIVAPIAIGIPGVVYYVVLSFVTVRSSMWYLEVTDRLDAANAARAEVAVMEERLRFARDLHDIMGRCLSVIALTAETATEMVARGDDRAGEQTREIRRLADDALRDARRLVAGYRGTDLRREVEGAADLLRSIGAEVSVEVRGLRAVEDDELFAVVIREAATNILRHAAPEKVAISLDATSLTVTNDGAHSPFGVGHGLTGLAERAEALGASLTYHLEGATFVLGVRLGERGAHAEILSGGLEPAGPAAERPDECGPAGKQV